MTEARRANFAAAIAILLAGALSSIWVFLVPIFQAPDEPAHFDYAASIYGADRLITLSDGSPDWIVSPYTKYLMQASDFERIVWHSSMRVAPGYGSKAYFARVDAGAPGLRSPLPPSGKISYIVRYYPFGFYALEALWMHGVSRFTDSLVTIFFTARLLCVFLMMIGLYFNYRTAINLEIPRWISVALTAAVGLFPLTSFVSSYVQPDNLAFALVSAALFFATELRKGVFSLRATTALGISLGLLAITKYQFFLSAAVPALLLFAVRFAQTRSSDARRLGALAAIAAPSALLLAAQHWLVGRSNVLSRSNVPSDMTLGYFRGALAHGVPSALGYVSSTTVSAFVDCFVSGPCASTYWQTVGWLDTPIVVFNGTAEVWAREIISFTAVAVFGFLVVHVARSLFRLSRAMWSGHLNWALQIASGDPVFNSYVVFLALMLALYVATDNAYGAEGRQFYPYVFPAFLCFVWYAPLALRKRRGVASIACVSILLAYVIASSGYALADVVHRYYGPALPGYVATEPLPAQVVPRNAGVLWPLVGAEYQVYGRNPSFSFRRGSRLLEGGWTILPETGAVPSRIAVVLDSHISVPVLARQYSPAVAEATHSVSDGYSGFYATVPTSGLREGPHIVAAYAQRPDGRYDRIGPVRLFFLTDSDGNIAHVPPGVYGKGFVSGGSFQSPGTCIGDSSSDLGMRRVASGAVLRFVGRAGRRSAAGSYEAAWLLADRKPYPARYDRDDGSLFATIPTLGLAPGRHYVVAYAILDSSGESVQLARGVAFRVVPGRDGNTSSAGIPTACADPQKQLAETSN